MQETKVGTASMSYNDALCEFHSFVYFKEMTTTLQIKEKKTHWEKFSTGSNVDIIFLKALWWYKMSYEVRPRATKLRKITRGNNAKNYTASL